MADADASQVPFYVKDCALATIAMGSKAQTLGELRDRIKTISAESIYYHFWRQSIEASLVPGAYHNDFSNWAHYQLHDDILAERLSLMDPSEYVNLEQLREDMIEVIENRLDEQDGTGLQPSAQAFHFIKSKIVVFNTSFRMDHPKDLVKTLPILSSSSIFYHFIDARRRDSGQLDDFSLWLRGYSQEFLSLMQRLKSVDPYFIPLKQLQERLILIVTDYFLDDRGGE